MWVVSLVASCTPPGSLSLRAGAALADGSIVRDQWGVPYIEAADDGQASYAMAWAMAEDGLPALEDAYASALGTAASGDAAKVAFADASAEIVLMCSAFAAGLNEFRRQHPQLPTRQIERFEPWMVYAFARDVGLVHSVINDAFVAVGVSATGDALFAASGASAQPYEVDIRTADGRAVHGFAELGMPFIREGFTRYVAFAASPLGADRSADRSADRGRQDVVHQWVSMSRAATPSQAAAAAVGGVDRVGLAYMHVSGATNTTAEASPASRMGFAAGAVIDAVPLSIAKLTAIAFDTRMHVVDTAVAGLVDEWEQVGARNSERAAALDSAVLLLRGWDGRITETSVAATLMAAYIDQLAVLQNDGAYTRFRALEAVLRGRTFHSTASWSRSHPLVRPVPSTYTRGSAVTPPMPIRAASGRYGTMFAYESGESLQRRVWAVNITAGVGGAVLSYGQSWDPGSAHWLDQAGLFATATLKPVAVDGAAAGGKKYRPALAAETR